MNIRCGSKLVSKNNIFGGSSAVEQFAVNELVVGSIPTHRADKSLGLAKARSLLLLLGGSNLTCVRLR